MKNISNLGIDVAKEVFQLYGNNERENNCVEKRLKRKELAEEIMKMNRCTIGMEACAGAHYWGRKFESYGHRVKLMSPQYVKPYVKSNKNDRNDAEGIYEAMRRKSMRFVPVKSVKQQDMQNLHNVRSRLIKSRVMLSNQVRGILAEYGIVIKKGRSDFKKELPRILEEADNELTASTRELLGEQMEEYAALTKKIKIYEERILEQCRGEERCRNLQTIPGIGPLTASALVSLVGENYTFKRGRDLGAFLGLVPKQNSSGETVRLGGISKRGNLYLRTLLVHGGRSVIVHHQNRKTAYGRWVKKLVTRRGWNRAAVAIANKNARVAWVILSQGGIYDQRKIVA